MNTFQLHTTRLIVLAIALFFGMNSVLAFDTGTCWITEEDCPTASIMGLEYQIHTAPDRDERRESKKIHCRYESGTKNDSISIEYQCFKDEAEAQLEYEYATYQKERPSKLRRRLQVKECNLVSSNSGGCRGFVVIGRYLAKVQGRFPWNESLSYNEKNAKADAEAMKRVEAGKIAALNFSPEGRPPLATIKGRAYGLDILKLKQPIPYAKIELDIGGTKYETKTDLDGAYTFNLDTETKQGKLKLTLEGYQDGINTFEIVDNSIGTDVVEIWRDIDIQKEKDFVVHMVLSNDYESTSGQTRVRGLVDKYAQLAQAMDFAELILMTDVSQIKGTDILPITVFAYSPDADNVEKSTHYDPTYGSIHLTTKDSEYHSPESPLALFHEFGHHIMKTIYEPVVWNTDLSNGGFNHGGMLNSSTADSVGEGLATFLALLMAQVYGHVYPLFYLPSPIAFGYNWEVNYKAWDMESILPREEFAVVSLLNDLMDKHNEKSDDVQVGFTQLWDIIKDENNQTVKDYYDALLPLVEKEKLDLLFIAHGFFWDKQDGDRQFSLPNTYRDTTGEHSCTVSNMEPAYDMDKNGSIDPLVDPWVDYSNWHEYPCEPTYDEGDVVGLTGASKIQNRKTFQTLSNRFMEVENGTHTLEFTFPENPEYNYSMTYEIVDGRLPVTFPPARYKASVNIDKDIEITSEEYFEAIAQTAGTDSFRSEKRGSFGYWVILLVVVGIGVMVVKKK